MIIQVLLETLESESNNITFGHIPTGQMFVMLSELNCSKQYDTDVSPYIKMSQTQALRLDHWRDAAVIDFPSDCKIVKVSGK